MQDKFREISFLSVKKQQNAERKVIFAMNNAHIMKIKRIINSKLLIALSILVIIITVIVALCNIFADNKDNSLVQKEYITVNGEQHPFKEYLAGCIMYSMRFVNDITKNESLEGIKAVGVCLKKSIEYLDKRNALPGVGIYALHCMTIKEGEEFYGEEFKAVYELCLDVSDLALNSDIYKDEDIFLPVCSVSSGALSHCEAIPHTKALYCPKDKENPWYKGSMQLIDTGFAEILLRRYDDLIISPERERWISDISRDENGMVTDITVCGLTMSGFEFCRIMGIKSPCFTYTYSGDIFTFETKGIGNNTGLSCNTAVLLSKKGERCEGVVGVFFGGIFA